ncbi:MAG TPA: sulfite exporter TauE/SafE family protein [Candidatus Bathyarchaeota archaeon]|nr:sulfite exporter TauE/SafE family protein [Candidatus Bathyarchaeota archaeon]
MMWLLPLLVVFAAGVVQGLTGFGFALVSAPLLSALMEPRLAMPIVVAHGSLITLLLLPDVWRWIDVRMVIPLAASGLIGIPIGAYLLRVVEGNTLRVLVGLLVILFSLLLLLGVEGLGGSRGWMVIPVGLLSGILGGSTTMSGPPVILFLTHRGVEKRVFRASLIAYFTILGVVAIPTYILNGLINIQTVRWITFLMPSMALGAVVGARLSRRVAEEPFRRFTLLLVMASGLLSLLTGLDLL